VSTSCCELAIHVPMVVQLTQRCLLDALLHVCALTLCPRHSHWARGAQEGYAPDFFSRCCSRMSCTLGASDRLFMLMLAVAIASASKAASLSRMMAVLPVPAAESTYMRANAAGTACMWVMGWG